MCSFLWEYKNELSVSMRIKTKWNLQAWIGVIIKCNNKTNIHDRKFHLDYI